MTESNVRQIRPNQPFIVGDRVHIGTSTEVFTVANLGPCGPIDPAMINSHEFVQLAVPGIENRIFEVHASYLRRAT